MKITAVKTFLLQHSLPKPTGPSTYFYTTRRSLLIKLETDEGLVGWGETAAFGGVRTLIEQQFASILIGQNPLEHRRLWRELWGPNFGSGIAVGGIDIALHDLRGKALNQSIGEMYGGRLRERVPAYASAMNYIQGVDPVDQYPDEAQAMTARGFQAMKMRIGALSMRQDLAAVAAVRSAVGPDIKLMADGNGAYTLPGAVAMGRELEELGLHWFEEPLPQNAPHYAGYDVLTDKLDIAIAAGEGLDSRGAFDSFIGRRAADIVQPDVSLCGGIAETLFIAELARMRGIQCMPHCWAGAIVIAATVHLLSLLPDSSWARTTETPMLELDMVENPFRDDLLTEPLEIEDGFVSVPTGPGLGIEVDEEMMRRYVVD
jgi:D-galactarolactone cycloisomerase